MAAYNLEASESTVGLRLRFRTAGLDESVVPTLVGALPTRVIGAPTLRVARQQCYGCIYTHGTAQHDDKHPA